MLNKPIKIKRIAMLTMALFFWLSGVSLFAQNKQSNSQEPEKKQVPSAHPKVSLSNQDPKVKKADEDALRKQAQMEKLRQQQAADAKKQSQAKAEAKAPKTSKSTASTSAKAPTANAAVTNSNQETSANKAANAQDIQKDWEKKKAKITADMKSKGASQNDIDKQIAAMEKQLNINTNTNK
jgi:hypothetical protein